MRPTVIVFGDKARKALGLPEQLLHPVERDGVVYRQLPLETHPAFRALATVLLDNLYEAL